MPGRPHSQKSAVAFAVAKPLYCVQSRAGRPQGGVERRRGGDGVLVEVPAAGKAVALDPLDVGGVVDDLELGPRRPPGLERHGHRASR